MVWDGESELPVVPTRWALLGVALGGAPVWPCGGGAGFTEESVGRRPPCYLPLEQLNWSIVHIFDMHNFKAGQNFNSSILQNRDICH